MRTHSCTDKDGNITDPHVRRTKHHINNLEKHILADEADAQSVIDNESKCLWAAMDGFVRSANGLLWRACKLSLDKCNRKEAHVTNIHDLVTPLIILRDGLHPPSV